MEQVLRSIDTFKLHTKEEYKLVVLVNIQNLEDGKVKATLLPRIQHDWDGTETIIPFPTNSKYEKEFTKEEVGQAIGTITIPEGLTTYEQLRLIELETAKIYIEQGEHYEINGVLLKGSDFEIVTI